MVKMINAVVIVVSLAAMIHRIEAKDYTIGDDLGWTIPPNGACTYEEWASKHDPLFLKVEAVGFNFEEGKQDVALVREEDFHSCCTKNLLWHSRKPVLVTFIQEGTFYFIGTLSGHCAKGQKIALKWIKPRCIATAFCPTPSSSADAKSSATLPLKVVARRV